MDGNRHQSLSDEALDRELAAALNAEPAPEFVARVRTRIAAESLSPTAAPLPRWMAWAGAAAVVMLAASLGVWSVNDRGASPAVPADARHRGASSVSAPASPPPDASSERPSPAIPRVVEQQSEAPASATSARPRAARVMADARPVAQRFPEPPFAEVLISEDEVRAFRRFMEFATAVARGRPAADGAAAQELDVPDIAIAPVIIEPLPQLARLETGE